MKYLAFLLLPSFVLPACAQSSLGVHFGYDAKAEDAYVGASNIFDIGSLGGMAFMLNPELNFYPFMTDVTFVTANANLLVGFGELASEFVPFAGAGAHFRFVSVEGQDNEADAGFNLTGGVLMRLVSVRPYVQARLSMAEGTAFAVQGGVAFML